MLQTRESNACLFHQSGNSENLMLTCLLLYCEKSLLLEALRMPLLWQSTTFMVEKGGRTFLSSSDSAPHLRRGCLSSSDSAPNFRNGRCADKHSMSLCWSTIIQTNGKLMRIQFVRTQREIYAFVRIRSTQAQ